MVSSSFTTHPISLEELLKDAKTGKLQLPDFQRNWVWDEQRIIDLLASISRDFPIGAIMTLNTGGEVNFSPRPVEGATQTAIESAESLLLDGQQRITSLFQVTLLNQIVKTKTVKGKAIERWFYVDMRKAIDENVERSEAIFNIPKDKKLKENFDRDTILDLSTQELEFENLMFPLSRLFDWNNWQTQLITFLNAEGTFTEVWDSVVRPFSENFIEIFKRYAVPVISLDKATSKEAVCTVFEKVNTGGKALDAFELVTAMYAADGYRLRDDWYGTEKGNLGYEVQIRRFASTNEDSFGMLANVANTDFLQAISLFHTLDLREAAKKDGKQGKELPQVTGKRSALLNLPLSAYLEYKDKVLEGFRKAAKFLRSVNIYTVTDLPYQTQVVPLAAILAFIGDEYEIGTIRDKLQQWYWCGVLGELYGSSAETRMALDFVQVPIWLRGGEAPQTVTEANFHIDRLKTMRMRLSAGYKGINALIMNKGAKDFRSGQTYSDTVFFEENVDIHHIFPRKWCEENGKDWKVFDSIINKTPISYRTNRIIGGVAPSVYLEKLETGTKTYHAIAPEALNQYLESHLIDPNLVRSDDYESFIKARQIALAKLIAEAMGKSVTSTGNDDSGWGESEAQEQIDLSLIS